jgi:hypothetical protein
VRRHCSDEVLIAHADGELTLFWRRRVRSHLNQCWQCRARLSELEGQAELLSRAFQEDLVLPPERLIAARQNLAVRQAAFENASGARPRRLLAGAAAFGLAAAAYLLFVVVRPQPPEPHAAPRPARILELATAADTPGTDTVPSIHQHIELEIRNRQAKAYTSGNLKLWSDGRDRRAGIRWETGAGHLEYAAWKSEDANRFTYHIDPELRHRLATVRVSSNLALTDLPERLTEPQMIEAAFLAWLDSRDWRPVSLARDFAVFATREGVSLTVERQGGEGHYRLRATHVTGDRRVEAILEVQPGWKARLMEVRFVSPRSDVDLRIRMVRSEPVDPSRLSADLVYPVSRQTRIAPSRPEPQLIPATPQAPGWSESDSDQAVVAATHALHRAGACLGEPVLLERTPGGAIRVHGLVRSVARREELREALQLSGTPVPITVELQTFEEAASSAALRETAPAPDESGPPARARRLPVERELARYFAEYRSRIENKSAAEFVAQFANRNVRAGQRAMAHAWALKRLTNSFPESVSSRLGRRQRSILESVTRDHLASLWSSLAEVRTLMEPVFAGASAHDAGSMAGEIVREDELLDRLFDSVRSIDERLRYLLAGEPIAAGSLSSDPAECILGLGRDLAAVHRQYSALEARRVIEASEVQPASPRQ